MMENDDKCMLYQNLFLFFLLDDRLSIVYINSFKLEYLLSCTFFTILNLVDVRLWRIGKILKESMIFMTIIQSFRWIATILYIRQ